MKEEWKTIEGYENYKVSNHGRVININTGKIKALNDNGKGYLTVLLSNNGISKRFYIHRLVGFYFIPNPENLYTIDHWDGNPYNNNVDNLHWLSQKDNVRRFFKEQITEEQKEHYKVVHQRAVVKAQAANKRPVMCTDNGIVYESIAEASKALGISKECISYNCSSKQTHAQGYHFQFYNEDKTYQKTQKSKVHTNGRKLTPIICTTTGIIYESVSDAAEKLNILTQGIYGVLWGKIKTTNNLQFEYYTEETV